LKQIIKKYFGYFGIYVSKNHKYDALLEKIIKKDLSSDSNCIDVGSHKGEILDLFLKYSPAGKHFGFEPLPHLFKDLTSNYSEKVTLINCGLSDSCGEKEFTHVLNAEAFSGFKERDYLNKDVTLNTIPVKTCTLDQVVSDHSINAIELIKIDVEGAELEVLRGGLKTIKALKPLIVFEHGKGAAEYYETTPEAIFSFFSDIDMTIKTLSSHLKDAAGLSKKDFINHFNSGSEYYFIAE